MSNNEILKGTQKFSKATFDSFKSLYDINANIAAQVADQQIAFTNLYIEYASRQINILGEGKDYKEIASKQSGLIREITEKAQGIVRNTIDIVNESKDEVSAWVEQGVEKVASVVPFNETVGKAASKTA